MVLITTFCFIAIAIVMISSLTIFRIHRLIKHLKKRIKDENLNTVSTINPDRSLESTLDQTSISFVHESNIIEPTSYRSVANFNDTNRFQQYLGKFDILLSNDIIKYHGKNM